MPKLQPQLFGVTPMDPATLLAAVIVLFIVSALACLVPVRRASSVNPTIALRTE